MSEHQKFTLEQLKGGESVLSKQTAGALTSQKGMTGIGMPRPNVTKDKQLGFIPLDERGLCLLRNQTGKAAPVSQEGMLPMGAARPQAFKIIMKPEWKTKEAKIAARKSDGVMPKQAGDFHFANQSSTGVTIGARRNQCTNVRSRMKKDLRCEGAAPFQSGTNKLASQKLMTAPPGTGAYRKQTSNIDYKMDEEKMRAATQVTPWFNGLNKFASQKLSGGFSKSRDVCPHVKDFDKAFLSNDKMMECHGVLSAQRGTNKLASQHGMTGQSMIGGIRNQVNRAHWKQEWLDQLEEAEKEWKISHPRYGEPEPKVTEIIIPKKEKTPAPVEEEVVHHEEEAEAEEEEEEEEE